MRSSEARRRTKETDVSVSVNLDGTGVCSVATGIGFLDHMLTACGRHGRMDLVIQASGDLEVDCHHTMEDVGIVFGTALKAAIGDGRGICRFAHTAVPMDESLAEVAMDFGGRGYLVFNGSFSPAGAASIPGDLFEHFFYSLCINAGITAHISFYGQNDHHKCEAIFKAFGRALNAATAREAGSNDVPSTKGTL